MKTATLYRLASSPRDYARCHALLRAQAGYDTPLQFPTVMALDTADKLLGFVGTHPHEDAIVCGPLVMLASHANGFRWRRFVEAYENVLMAAGVRLYLFSIDEKDSVYCRAVKELGAVEFGRHKTDIIFKRDMRAEARAA